MVKKWLGNVGDCDICGRSLQELDTFYDAKTQQGPWGLLCRKCWQMYGVGLGIGRGQEYESESRELLRGGSDD